MGRLCVLRLCLIDARRIRQVRLAEVAFDQPPGGADRLLAQGDAVGPHIGDQTDRLAADVDAPVQPLRHFNGARCAAAQLAAGSSEQRRVGKGGVSTCRYRWWSYN